jgi:predicted phage terminase large subunit-like protein
MGIDEIKELDSLLYSDEIYKARNSLLDFTKSTLDGFQVEDFHRKYYTLLDKFAKGEIKKLIITMPPQHGKSEGSSRRLPAYILGINPDKKIAVSSYNTTFASKFNRDIQRIIDTPKYFDIFPKTTLNASNVVTVSSNYLRNSLEFEIIGKKGGLKSVGRGGALTGNRVDVMIMDDLYKDYMEGNSPLIRENVWDWYTSVVSTRLHNNSQELIVFTRWHEDDLIGRLESNGKVKELKDMNNIPKLKNDEWLKVNFEAIKESEKTQIDNRNTGDSLWESMHSKEGLISSMEMDVEKFKCLYQGNPQSKEGLLYSDFKTYTDIPQLKQIKNYTDTADTGTDKLCSIVYGIPLSSSDTHLYVLDVLYTDEPMEKTEPLTIDLLNKNNVNISLVESNNGGRGFARIVQAATRTNVKWFHQSSNKEARIFSNSASVSSKIVFPKDWFLRWTPFYNDVTKYKKLFKANKFDDAPDTLTGIIEEETKGRGQYDIR